MRKNEIVSGRAGNRSLLISAALVSVALASYLVVHAQQPSAAAGGQRTQRVCRIDVGLGIARRGHRRGHCIDLGRRNLGAPGDENGRKQDCCNQQSIHGFHRNPFSRGVPELGVFWSCGPGTAAWKTAPSGRMPTTLDSVTIWVINSGTHSRAFPVGAMMPPPDRSAPRNRPGTREAAW